MPNAPLKSLPKMDEQISVVWSAPGSLLSSTWAHHIKFVAKERIELSLLRVGSDFDCTQSTSRDLHSLILAILFAKSLHDRSPYCS
jgi:hypothetical protein